MQGVTSNKQNGQESGSSGALAGTAMTIGGVFRQSGNFVTDCPAKATTG
jgi:hypothetical protein